ncbi:bifunctional DNA-formamidopyrimidine glycosylase/DNA-(apurinic or apyrimidinic site) lyase [Auritidibacter ignavus]|uniref:bifunctional DNA-formamidopyrimidine glycosylase/DNA-(apurinic or apyrimidinic site) lyase n=1 Tax=Auritidibacter ignavus TaxID=678932 RepID=UPI0024BA5624|nr:bifunctional DNA-formamidopyrimidine glycosylase/DNA-(apurinic or apyrimidinic site) lyase [Auritidibacter ignavus]WHS35101.1 bifunctional DNA-formamidopyrimidine glycosylase/DNA-(apurinic or apyrimidinic site) lyase [Auritidibacter ignavus]
MPELPEVEVVRRGLSRWITNQQVLDVEVLDPRSVRRHRQGPIDFVTSLRQAELEQPQRRGKYLWIPLDCRRQDRGHPTALVVHLGMSGQVLLNQPDAPDPKHLRIRITLIDSMSGEPMEMRFVDQRIFGGLYLDRLDYADDVDELIPATVSHIGRDPLDGHFDVERVYRILKQKQTGIKRALLDQSLASGIGNIYADEALWRAKIHYLRPCNRLTRQQIRDLYTSVQYVMKHALDQGGTSFDALYVNVNGESGYFNRSLQVYGQDGRNCSRCLDEGYETTIRREKFMNRSSYFCPRCQPAPRKTRR